MSNNTTNNCTDTTDHIDVIPVCIYSFIFLVGLIFNLIALVIFFRHSKSKSPTVVYMTNLAIADVLLILTLPVRIYYHVTLAKLPPELCDVVGLVLKANMYGSIFLLTCISLDRCMAINFPITTCVQDARKKAPLFCVGIWTFTFGASVLIYLSKRQDVANNGLNQHCFDNLPVYAITPGVVFTTLAVGFGIPFLTMLICSCGLVHAVRQSIVAKINFVDSRKIQKMITASLLIFLLSFLPYHVTLTFLSLSKKPPCVLLDAYSYSLMVACFNTVLDPIAYYFTTDTFRKNLDFSENIPLNS
ncbi:lysophosphatidic acid receptor 6 [Sphaeramia orbicularis]|nr:lysophosphatidic acid receptor 6-like [Sphaeramia orbicularis]